MIVDMSPKAITERLRLASQLAALCLALGKARVAGATSIADHRIRKPRTGN
jgi:hypothetical protein